MDLDKEIQNALSKTSFYVSKGVEQILAGQLDEIHGVSVSPGATALASLALLAVGEFESAQLRGIQWLKQNHQGGWGKFPGDKPDEEIIRIAGMVLYGSQGGWKSKFRLLSQLQQFSQMVLSLGREVVPGLEGPTPEEILLPMILEERVLSKLPTYGRPVVVAASLLGTDSQEGISKGVQYLLETQMPDGSWSEDIIATSLAVLAIMRMGGYSERMGKAGRWLVQKQYLSGGWPAFDQLKVWAIGWAVCIFGESTKRLTDIPWLKQAVAWLKQGQNSDGSFGSTPPFTHPDLDDTAVALLALHQVNLEDHLGLDLLKQLQNIDGSWSTFPSFTGTPPKISSEFPVYIPSVDVSIHVLEALWRRSRSQDEQIWRGLNWLLSQQDEEGAFQASWFEGRIYSTAQALELFGKWKFCWERWNMARHLLRARKKSLAFIIQAQNNNGGWGSVVETSLALSGLMMYARVVPRKVINSGVKNILRAQNVDGSFKPFFQGIYAKGWNYEEPLTTALTAMRALQRYQRLYGRLF